MTAPEDCQRQSNEELEGNKSSDTCPKEAQVDEVDRRKGKDKDHAKIGGDKNNESTVWRP